MILTSCNAKVVEKTVSTLITHTAESKTILEIPNGQIEKVFVIDGYICSTFDRGMNEYVLEIRSLSDTSHTVSLIPYGTGEDKMLLVDYSVSGTKILVRDIVQHNYAIVDIHEVMENPSHSIAFKPYTLLTQEMIPIDDGRIAYLNQGSFRSSEKRYYVIGKDEQPRKLSRNGRKSLNVLDGFFLYEPGKDKLAFLNMYTPEIEYYSFHNKKLLSKSRVERENDVQIIELTEGRMSEYLFVNHVPLCFVAGSSDSERIVAVYCDAQEHFHILLLDWDGNLQRCFISEGIVLSASLCNEYLYCWVNSDDVNKLVQYDIRNN